MIISRKRFEQEIEKALSAAEKERWQYERTERIEREAHRRMDILEERISKLERIAEQPIVFNSGATCGTLKL